MVLIIDIGTNGITWEIQVWLTNEKLQRRKVLFIYCIFDLYIKL